MLGRQHFLLSVSTAFLVFSPLIHSHPLEVTAILIGVGIGSLIPDIDASKSTIFKTSVKGLNNKPGKLFNRFIGPFMPVIGYGTKYLVYLPSLGVLDVFTGYDFSQGHRSFTHSILGVCIISLVTGIFLYPLFDLIDFIPSVVFWMFMTGYVSGVFLHMLQDSFTVTGIVWNRPFSDHRLKGSLTTGEDTAKPRYFMITLVLLMPLNIYSVSGLQSPGTVIIHGVLVSVAAWSIFSWVSDLKLYT